MHPYKHMSDMTMAVVNVSRVLDSTDNGKTLVCRATHMALERPVEDSTEVAVECTKLFNNFSFSPFQILQKIQLNT